MSRRYESAGRAGRADLFDRAEGFAQIGQPRFGVAADETYAPGERIAAAARDAGVDECVEHLSFGLAQPCHDRRGQRGEQFASVIDMDTPRNVSAEAVLGLAGD